MLCDLCRLPHAATRGEAWNGEQSVKLHEIGDWSEIRLHIVKEYEETDFRIFSATLYHNYIDAFDEEGSRICVSTRDFVLDGYRNGLLVKSSLREYHLNIAGNKKMNERFVHKGD